MLRPYQSRSIQDVEQYWRVSRSVLLVLPTGAGKTHCAAELIRRRRVKTLVLAPRKELVYQAERRIREHVTWAKVGVWHGRKSAAGCDVQIACVPTADKRPIDPDVGLIIPDEAHRALGTTYARVIRRFPNAKVVGLTATPIRLDNRPMGRVFDQMVVGTTAAELVAQGHLCPISVYGKPAHVDLSAVKKDRRTKDYNKRQLARVMNTPVLVGDAVTEWMRHARGLRTVVFCTSLAHAHAVHQQFQARGVRGFVVTGSTPQGRRENPKPGTREHAFAEVRANRAQMLINVDCLAEGFDLPELECAIQLRPTASLALHLQQVGRVMRTAPGKSRGIVLDHANNFERHGFPTDPRKWSLDKGCEADPSSATRAGTVASVTCSACFTLMSAAATMCPNCGHVELPQAVPADLVPLRPRKPETVLTPWQ